MLRRVAADRRCIAMTDRLFLNGPARCAVPSSARAQSDPVPCAPGCRIARLSQDDRTTERPSAVPPAALQRAGALYAQGRWAEAESLCRALLAREPGHYGALSLLGILLAHSGRAGQGAQLLGRLASALPGSAEAQINYGSALRALGRHRDALACYERALGLQPQSATAHYNRGLTLEQLGYPGQAIDSYERALALKPDYLAAWNARGGALGRLGRHEEALQSIERAIALEPRFAPAYGNRGIHLRMLGQFEAALESFERAIALDPRDVVAYVQRGAVLRELQRTEEALESFEQAIALRAEFAEAHALRADALSALERFEEALTGYERALALRPDIPEAHAHRGAALTALRRHTEALASYDRALAADPRCIAALVNRGVTLHELRQFDAARASLDQAIRLAPRDARAHERRGAVLQALDAREEAAASYARALEFDPRGAFVLGNCCHAHMQIGEWSRLERDRAQIAAGIARGEALATPFVVLSLFDSPALQRQAAQIWVRRKFARIPQAGRLRHPPHERIRIGYFSADFAHHAVAMLAAGLFERHDRARFELTAFSLGPAVPDALGARIEAAFERFLRVGERTDREVAALARELQIDIAVDLGGYTRDARPGIAAWRAAPIQVSYLGYLGTLGASFIDYLIADPVLVPSEARGHYSEKIAYLPSYQINDRKRPAAAPRFTRAQLGLPPTGFVFCCFNNTYKITPETFASWMRILAAVPGSVLFLLGSSPAAERNLRREAARASIEPARLVFGGTVSLEEYLARYRAADLFLDTLPYNAGTTASDALWAGLPVLTLAGESFAARMGASVVTAAGFPELVARSRADYERRAIELASDAPRLGALKTRLAAERDRCALFDTLAVTAQLESLYEQMYERHLAGLPAEHLFAREPGARDRHRP